MKQPTVGSSIGQHYYHFESRDPYRAAVACAMVEAIQANFVVCSGLILSGKVKESHGERIEHRIGLVPERILFDAIGANGEDWDQLRLDLADSMDDTPRLVVGGLLATMNTRKARRRRQALLN